MTEVTIVGVDIAKNVFHLHGSASDGSVVFRKKLTRTQFQRFMASQPACIVAMEACGGAHHWAREMKLQGHEPRLIAPGYVRPFVKRQKNDMADAEAIVEAALRPTMRFVEAKDEAAQARCMLFRVRDQLVRQRSQTVNALRAFLAEFGQVAPVGMQNVTRLATIVADTATPLPALARELCEEMLERISAFSERLVHGGSTKWPHRPHTLHAFVPCRAWGLSQPSPSAASPRRWSSFDQAEILPLGSDWCRDRIRPVAKNASGGCQRWARAISGGYWSSARWPSFDGRVGEVTPGTHG